MSGRSSGKLRALRARSRAGGGARSAPPAAGRGPVSRAVLRSWLVFVATFAVLEAVVQLDPGALGRHAIDATAHLTAGALWLLGADGRVRGDLVVSELLPIRIVFECTAVVPILLYVAAVLAHPCRWSAKAIGLLAGIPALVTLNVVRLVTLCWVGRWYPAAFDATHSLLWQSLMIFLTAFVWVLWTSVARPREARAA